MRGNQTLSQQKDGNDLSEFIAENFGANATYVEGLLSRFRSNPQLVDESWRAYFTELLGEAAVTPRPDSSENGRGVATEIRETTTSTPSAPASPPAAAAQATAPEPKVITRAEQPGGEAIPIRG